MIQESTFWCGLGFRFPQIRESGDLLGSPASNLPSPAWLSCLIRAHWGDRPYLARPASFLTAREDHIREGVTPRPRRAHRMESAPWGRRHPGRSCLFPIPCTGMHPGSVANDALPLTRIPAAPIDCMSRVGGFTRQSPRSGWLGDSGISPVHEAPLRRTGDSPRQHPSSSGEDP